VPEESYSRHRALETKLAEPSNPVRGMVNDFFDALGLPRPDEVLPLPADVARALGVPTVEQAVPTPKEVGERLATGTRRLPPPPLPTPRRLAEETLG